MIGLEIHTYLITKQKLFCSCKNSREKGLKPNSNICPICTGQPGSKPMKPLEEAVFNATQIGLMLGCTISDKMPWQRKHYNWPDLPKGYQLTLSGSHSQPLGLNGNFHGIKISSMHLEEDPASWNPDTGEVDYNRSGIPLVEIVTDPDFTDSNQVVEWLSILLQNLMYLGVVDSNAGIKVDVNVNIHGKTERTEIKNISSLESIKSAIDFELERHNTEGQDKKETRRFNSNSGKTEKMRDKEDQDDYRFIRDPDLPLLVLDQNFIECAKKALPETPEEKMKKLTSEFGLEEKEASIISSNRFVSDFYEKVASEVEPKLAYFWVTGELLRLLNTHDCQLTELDIKIDHFVQLIKLVQNESITALKAKEIIKQFYPKSFMPEVESLGKITDKEELSKIINEVLENNKEVVDSYRAGKKESLNFLFGEVMKATKKRADVKTSREILTELLNK